MNVDKIAIIGSGAVGTTTAYSLIANSIASEIMIADVNLPRLQGEILDLEDALTFSDLSKVKIATIAEAAQADIIIVTAGASQQKGETRLDLLNRNISIMESIVAQMTVINPNAIIIVASNPVDILSLKIQQLTGHPKEKVIGSGTFLDTQRLRSYLSQKLNVSSSSIHAYVLGEHGDSQFIAWESAQLAGYKLTKFNEFNQQLQSDISESVKNKAYNIINFKGATYYGIASCLTQICNVILNNQNRVLPLSSFIPNLDCYLSIPVVLGRQGIKQQLSEQLNKNEKEMLALSAENIKQYINPA